MDDDDAGDVSGELAAATAAKNAAVQARDDADQEQQTALGDWNNAKQETINKKAALDQAVGDADLAALR